MTEGKRAITRGGGAHIRGERAHFRSRWAESPRGPLILSPDWTVFNTRGKNKESREEADGVC
jgi:hypothetical protein